MIQTYILIALWCGGTQDSVHLRVRSNLQVQACRDRLAVCLIKEGAVEETFGVLNAKKCLDKEKL